MVCKKHFTDFTGFERMEKYADVLINVELGIIINAKIFKYVYVQLKKQKKTENCGDL